MTQRPGPVQRVNALASRAARRLVRVARRRLGPARLEILTYHFVSDRPNPFSEDGHRVPVSAFRDQLRWLKRHCRLVPLRAVPELRPTGSRPYAAIAFDDGYLATLEEAYPVLEAERVPATAFVCPSVLDNRGLLWRDKVRYLISRGRQAAFLAFLAALPDHRYRLDLVTPETFYTWSKRLETVGDMRIRRDLDAFFERQGISPAEVAARSRLFLAVREIVPRPYLDFGNHSWSHPLMTALTFAEQHAEIERAQRFLVERGIAPVGFAVPFGPYNQDTLDACAAVGVRMVFTIGPRGNRLGAAAGPGPLVLRRKIAPEDPAGLARMMSSP